MFAEWLFFVIFARGCSSKPPYAQRMNEMITILGPTASGKTTVATALAARLGAEIIGADSRQVYREMNIGTGKDLSDYRVSGKQVPYHLIDICEPGTKYNLFEYQQDFARVYNDMKHRHFMRRHRTLYRSRAQRLSSFDRSTESATARGTLCQDAR